MSSEAPTIGKVNEVIINNIIFNEFW